MCVLIGLQRAWDQVEAPEPHEYSCLLPVDVHLEVLRDGASGPAGELVLAVDELALAEGGIAGIQPVVQHVGAGQAIAGLGPADGLPGVAGRLGEVLLGAKPGVGPQVT